MKFKLPTKTLADALRTVSVCIPTGKQTLPILGNVKIEALKDSLSISATNLDIYVTQNCPASVEKKGSTTVSFPLLSQLLARMQASEVTMEQKNNVLEFVCGETQASLETLPAEEFPPTLAVSEMNKTECAAADILKPFSVLEHAIRPPGSASYVLQGINIAPGKNGSGHFTATNAARLVTYAGVNLCKQNVIVPAEFVRALIKIAPEGQLNIAIGDGIIAVSSDTLSISSKLIEGGYPNWENVIPDRIENAFSCGRQELIDALKICMIFTERQLPALNVTGKGKEVEVSQPAGKAKVMVMGTELSGQPDLTIRMNARFLIESLSVMESENVRIECEAKRSTVLIEDGPLRCIINKLISPD